ncbi:MFS transporter [Blastococcus sp. BMG 814]|uniref:MFS transporter n=1 Tax=Blastococcus carthaginiensis TaxID=3050034 RepID=A0ABT9IAA5_9ACTN|nr:MFS transporter [Blastococcus carthaginiensis]MDP5182505.1 MFS transporter [Blastococcus carthaginiensis]
MRRSRHAGRQRRLRDRRRLEQEAMASPGVRAGGCRVSIGRCPATRDVSYRCGRTVTLIGRVGNSGRSPLRRDRGATAGPSGRWAFATIAVSLLVLTTGAQLATPLYRLYGAEFGFSSMLVTALFAVYSIAVIPSLLIFGPLSDVIGRRGILLGAVVVAAVASVLFAMADGVAMLFAARTLQGLALGAVQGTATAALIDHVPRGDRFRAARVATAANLTGSAVGPLLGGALARYTTPGLVTPFLLEACLLTAAFGALLVLVPARPGSGGRWRPRRPAVPAGLGRLFAAAGSTAALSWAVASLFLALLPSYLESELGSSDAALSGIAVSLMLGLAAGAQPVLRRLGTLTAQAVGLGLLLIGPPGLLVAAALGSIPALLLACAVSGFGHGLTFGSALAEVSEASPADQRGELISAFQVIAFLGSGIPIIGVGLMAEYGDLLSAVQLFVIATSAGCLLALASLVTRRRSRRRRLAAPLPADPASPAAIPSGPTAGGVR